MKNINILEIGGGYGGFCSILHVMAEDRKIKIDEYSSFDLLEAQKLQKYYLGKTIHKSDYGIQKTTFKDQKDIENFENTYNYCVSFYALGEFPKEIQNKYIKCVVSKISHGFIIWNPPHDIINDDGKILLKTYHPNIQEDIEDPLTGTKYLEL
jgi:phospholipid N-methyltransferase